MSIDWNSRLAVSFKPASGASEIISPITNFEFSIEKNINIMDSIDAHNIGYSYSNPRYTLSFEVPALNVAVFRKITSVAVKGTKFSVGLATGNGQPDGWVFDSVTFSDCVINSESQTVDNTGEPVIKISGLCLDVTISDSGNVLTTNHTTGATGSLS